MRPVAVDSNVVIRFVTGDPPEQAEEVRALFAAAERGEVQLWIDEIVVAECVWVLHSFYGHERSDIARVMQDLVSAPATQVQDADGLLWSLDLYAKHNLDFADALLVVHARRNGLGEVVSYDRHFDGVPGVKRIEPGEALSATQTGGLLSGPD